MARTMRNYERETRDRVEFIRNAVSEAGARGVVFGNSGGKDCTLAGILCKRACPDTVGIILPCSSKRNYGEDMDDARASAVQYGIETRVIDLSAAFYAILDALAPGAAFTESVRINLPPRLRMAALYAVAAGENRLVAGTGNRSERHMGYFTKWGDGAYDFNPIGDLTVTEIYEFLAHLGAPERIVRKPPSAGLYEGQTDEGDMGVSYAAIDALLLDGVASDHDRAIIERYHRISGHKRVEPRVYGG